jgi:two-component system phosphate regulon response regulator PhoB
MATVLVVDDEPDLRELLAAQLRLNGHAPLLAPDGRSALALARSQRPGLVLLDLMLPDMPGTEVCRALKSDAETRNIPILILTARGDEIDRVVGLELGGDDYVVKPFSSRELMLRIRALLRRASSDPNPAAPGSGQVVTAGPLVVDRAAHRVWCSGQEVVLTALEFRLLSVLMAREDRVQPRGTLLEEVWDRDDDTATRTIDSTVNRLRKKLGLAGDFIQTVHGVGYRFSQRPAQSGP